MGGRNNKNRNKNTANTQSGIEIMVAKFGLWNTILGAVIGLVGVFITAYYGYLGLKLQTMAPIYETQTAVANLLLTPSETPAPTMQLSPTLQSSPTITPSEIPTLAALTPESTSTPNYAVLYEPCSDNVKAPCIYTVSKSGDSYTNIALKVYGTYSYAFTLLLYNREANGEIHVLNKGDSIICHSLTNLPILDYPSCNANQIFPCQYISRINDTFSKIATEFYGNEAYSGFLQKQNFIFGLSQTDVDSGFIPENTVIIFPEKP